MIHWDDGLTAILGLRGRCGVLRVVSEQLRANPLGDPFERYLPVYIPQAAVDASADNFLQHDARFPVVYYLPAYSGVAGAVFSPKAWDRSIFQRVDDLISVNAIAPVIVVAVDAWTRLGGSQYTDSGGLGNYASALVEDFIPAVEAALPVVRDAAGRGLIGKSSGGFGALHISMEYPEFFGAAAALSPDGYFPYSAVPAFISARREIVKAGGIHEFVELFITGAATGQSAHETIMVLAYAAAYCPRECSAYGFDLPFELESGAIDNAVFAQWQAFDPVIRAEDVSVTNGLRKMRGIYVDCGDRDEYGLDVAVRMFAARLRAADVAVTHEEYPGGHRGNAERYDVGLRFLAERLSR